MSTVDHHKPFPDYVTCPHCGEPEVEVWCYAATARCHACQQTFSHVLLIDCEEHCDRSACELGQPPTFKSSQGE